MRKYINGRLQDIISEKSHSETCKYNKFIEITKMDSEQGILIVKYKQCPRCKRYISGGKYDLSTDHY